MRFNQHTYQREKEKAFRELEREFLGNMPDLLKTMKVTWISSRAIRLAEVKEYDAAIMLMHEAMDLDYTNPLSRSTLAQIYRLLGQFENSYITLEKGFKEVTKRISSQFEEYQFYLEVGYASYYMGKKQQAVSAFKEALKAATDKSKYEQDTENIEFLKSMGTDFQRPEISDDEINELKEIVGAVEFQLL